MRCRQSATNTQRLNLIQGGGPLGRVGHIRGDAAADRLLPLIVLDGVIEPDQVPAHPPVAQARAAPPLGLADAVKNGSPYAVPRERLETQLPIALESLRRLEQAGPGQRLEVVEVEVDRRPAVVPPQLGGHALGPGQVLVEKPSLSPSEL